MRCITRAAMVAAVLVLPSVSFGVPFFAENFEVDPTPSWTVNGGPGDGAAEFFFDYSASGIPLAPNSGLGGAHALKLRANESSGIFSGLSVSPTGQKLHWRL